MVNAAGLGAKQISDLLGLTGYRVIGSRSNSIILHKRMGKQLPMPVSPVPSSPYMGIHPCTLDVKCGEGVGHTIPQKVSGKNDFSLSLRVRNHYRDCRIVVRQNGVEVAAKKMKKAIPAEMIQFKVSAA